LVVSLVICANAVDWLETLVSEMTLLRGILNTAHSLVVDRAVFIF